MAADFNRDGNLDLIAASFSDSAVALLPGDGFRMPTTYPIPTTATSLAVEDFNRDQAPDVAVGGANQPGTSGTGSVTVLVNTGDF
jgi:hypothetical protein